MTLFTEQAAILSCGVLYAIIWGRAHVVIILAGVYATYSKWIDIEIDLAKAGFSNPKPIIAIRPRGNERISERVRRAADRIVGWNTESIVSAIRDFG